MSADGRGEHRLRLLTVMNCPRHHPSGMPTASRNLSRAMEPLGWEIDNLYLDDLLTRGAGRLNHPLFGVLAVGRMRALEADRGAYDVLQVSGGDGCALGLMRRDASRRRRLVVARCHGLEHRYWAEYLREVVAGHERARLRHRLYFGGLRLAQVEWTIRLGDIFNCLTPEDAAYVLRHGWKRDHEVAVIPNGVEADQCRGDLPCLPAQHRLLWSGSWTWMKGRRVLVEVFRRLAESDPTVSLTVAGSGTDPARVLLAFPASLRPRIRVLPGVPHRELLGEMRKHRLLLTTSLFEGFGTVVIEAMAVGLPVVASHVGGAGLIHSGVSGFLAPPGDVDRLVTQVRTALRRTPAELMDMRRSARAAVAGLTWSSIAAETDRAYRAALARVRGRSDEA